MKLGRLLIKLLVLPFYRQHTEAFLLLGLALVGIVRPPTLLFSGAFLGAMALNTPAMLVLGSLLALYYWNAWRFVAGRLASPAYTPLHYLSLRPRRHRLPLLALTLLLLQAPALLYSLLFVRAAALQGAWLSLLLVLCLALASVLLPTLHLNRRLSRLQRPLQLPAWLLRWQRRVSIPIVAYYFTYLFSSQRRALLATKLLSLAFLYGIILWYRSGSYDVRMPLLGLCFVVTLHVQLVLRLRQFHDQYLTIVRNLPIPTLRRFGLNMLAYGLILLPELILLLGGAALEGHFAQAPLAWLSLPFTAVCLLTYYHSLLLLPSVQLEGFLRLVYLTFFGLFVAVLWGLPALVLALLAGGAGYAIFHACYYTHQRVVDVH